MKVHLGLSRRRMGLRHIAQLGAYRPRPGSVGGAYRRSRAPSNTTTHCAMLIDEPAKMRRAVWRCFLGASRSVRSISSIAHLKGSSAAQSARAPCALAGSPTPTPGAPCADAHDAYRPAPESTFRPPDDHGESPQTAPPAHSLSSLTFVIRDPGHRDTNHAEVGPNQAVITVAACAKVGPNQTVTTTPRRLTDGATSAAPLGPNQTVTANRYWALSEIGFRGTSSGPRRCLYGDRVCRRSR